MLTAVCPRAVCALRLCSVLYAPHALCSVLCALCCLQCSCALCSRCCALLLQPSSVRSAAFQPCACRVETHHVLIFLRYSIRHNTFRVKKSILCFAHILRLVEYTFESPRTPCNFAHLGPCDPWRITVCCRCLTIVFFSLLHFLFKVIV
jgi:hypothetical protein